MTNILNWIFIGGITALIGAFAVGMVYVILHSLIYIDDFILNYHPF
jgi:hypothetical protein